MKQPLVVVLDYGSGNIRSAEKALTKAGASVKISSEKQDALEADGLVVPGVGAFHACIAAIKNLEADRLIEQRLISNRSVLGICVGMQLMFEFGIEGGVKTAGLGQWPGTVTKLHAKVTPHIGWNQVSPGSDSRLFVGLSDQQFYFVHSYAVESFPTDQTSPLPVPVVSKTKYEHEFVSAVENGPLSAVQFHPEKSGDVGIQLLRNWISQL